MFAIPLLPSVGFVTGHIVLNLYDPEHEAPCRQERRGYAERGALLVDVYGPVTTIPFTDASEILIRGIWNDDAPFDDPPAKRWNVIGHPKRRSADSRVSRSG